MTVITTDPLWMQNLDYSGGEDRILIDALWGGGVVGAGDLRVTQRSEGTNMSVDVAAGHVVVPGTSALEQGAYLCRLPAKENITLDAAPSVGNTRYDILVAEVRDGQVDLGPNNDWQIRAVSGTPASSPVEPVLPDNCVPLSRITVASGTAAITNAMLSNRRTFAQHFSYATSTTLPRALQGQVVIETDTGLIKRGLGDGTWLDIRAGADILVNASGALLGSAPAVGSTVWKRISFSTTIGAIGGVGFINLPFSFTGILNFHAQPQLNTTPVIIGHRTDFGAVNLPNQIPVTVFNMGVAAGHADFRLSGNVNAFVEVLGW